MNANNSFWDKVTHGQPLWDESHSVLLSGTGRPDPKPHPAHHRSTKGKVRLALKLYQLFTILTGIFLMAALCAAIVQLPAFGDESAPTNNEVSQRYVEQGMAETGATNTVAGMILDYRAFDTFGESIVLFCATFCVSFLMRHSRKPDALCDKSQDKLLQTTVNILFPFVALYGVYVVLNGHLSPGGGFSGGAILGAGLILLAASYGESSIAKVLSPRVVTYLSVGSLSIYAVLKGFSFYTGANHLNLDISKGTPGTILSAGFILPLNCCVGIIVACTVYSFFSLFAPHDSYD